jgi:hypothetical protein
LAVLTPLKYALNPSDALLTSIICKVGCDPPQALLDEMKINYKKDNNRLYFINELWHNPLIPHRDEFLSPLRHPLVSTEFGFG